MNLTQKFVLILWMAVMMVCPVFALIVYFFIPNEAAFYGCWVLSAIACTTICMKGYKNAEDA